MISFIGLFIFNWIKLTSLGTIITGLSIFFDLKKVKDIPVTFRLIYIIPFIFIVSDFIRGPISSDLNQEFFLILGWGLIAVASFIYRDRFSMQTEWMLKLALSILVIVNGVSVIGYFANREAIDQLLLQSKSIPIFGGIHHIHFGIINALAIALLFAYFFHKDRKIFRNFYFYAGLIVFICFHILSSRTGLVSFYLSLFTVICFYTLKEKKYKAGLIGILTIILVNLLAISTSSSLQNKLSNSIEDIESWDDKESINYKSMGMRLEAYRISWAAFKDQPFKGYGATSVDSVMQKYYSDLNTVLYQENRVGPHNQYLEYAIKYGIWGFLFVILFYYVWIRKAWINADYRLLFVVLILAVSSVFESLFERQVSIFLVATVLPLISNDHKD
ncbi:O-antigen ligase family protein [bacterium]|nr:O-antigen ligase family protein [bacterium]